MAIKIQKPYTKTKRVGLDCGEGLTEQSHKRECDMNYILADYARTGIVRHVAKHQGRYDDVTVQDFQEAMFLVKGAQDMFLELPAETRKEFDNDPVKFLDYVQDPANKEKLKEKGLLGGNDGLKADGTPSAAPISDNDKTAAPGGDQTES
jgi:phage internal scaffolding protein